MKICLATYNIHRCFGLDGHHDADRIVAVIQEMDADIVALQEVESLGHAGLDLLAHFEQQTGMKAIAGPTIFSPQASYGNAVLTRLPIGKIERIDLSFRKREPRGALAIDFNLPQPFRLLSTHLGLKRSERLQQTAHLCRLLEEDHQLPHILAGDINEWFPWGGSLRCLRRHFGPIPYVATFPSRWPLLSLDRIMARPPLHLHRLRRHHSPLARIASDHLPLMAEITI
ncbi:MAG: endonuclease [Zetaproteobacteria bacterium CG_4_9_14_3_um_filter_49_83]|nr:MAG: hypothetical protein AUJ56_00905 [Zetaproteobacteria bacterium CG1_02_49_23]PIY54906.1 MAG: endonuclease [Zetaproteobacteria bacterium CG_4_10_14_0_8_um_filter_49_80]PJA35171.1 MAG: endonuclease [Zetaproteobacteria bacterium CG_4_9_14_3_um_filter_49_83]